MTIGIRSIGQYVEIAAEHDGTTIDLGLFDDDELTDFRAMLLEAVDECNRYLPEEVEGD